MTPDFSERVAAKDRAAWLAMLGRSSGEAVQLRSVNPPSRGLPLPKEFPADQSRAHRGLPRFVAQLSRRSRRGRLAVDSPKAALRALPDEGERGLHRRYPAPFRQPATPADSASTSKLPAVPPVQSVHRGRLSECGHDRTVSGAGPHIQSRLRSKAARCPRRLSSSASGANRCDVSVEVSLGVVEVGTGTLEERFDFPARGKIQHALHFRLGQDSLAVGIHRHCLQAPTGKVAPALCQALRNVLRDIDGDIHCVALCSIGAKPASRRF